MSIRSRVVIVLVALAPIASAACGWFDDPTPEYLYFKVDGPAGTEVQAVYSTQFVAAVNEAGVTQVNVFYRDTVVHTLPVDTSFYIGIDRRWFVELSPVTGSASLRVQVDVDDRRQINEAGTVSAAEPWRYAYLFNQRVTRIIDSVL